MLDKHMHVSRSMWFIASFDRDRYPELVKSSPRLYDRIMDALKDGNTSASIMSGAGKAVYAPNILTNAGMTVMAGRSTGDDDTTNTHMGIGTGSTAETINDVALEASVARKIMGTRSTIGQTERYATSFVYEDLPAGSPNVVQITEGGIFNAAVDGTLIARITGNPQELELGSIVALTVVTTHENGVNV